eukprot:TRINITY_DN228_c0_g1_i7.p2 TRINITY_DN228_c0_g1~~TRINITY_DN228_c0_g1_i7.p2  ORF type:complete len:257 (+),score=59.42 TRINITY_DN228_c0_g1_i7:143-913(+)
MCIRDRSIAKGVGFRFCDLTSVFDRKYFEDYNTIQPPTLMHLSVNFRSHGRILDLANSIVTLLEIFFPQTIDKMKKERSNLDGPKPMIINSADLELLFLVLFGEDQYKSQQQGGMLSKPPLEFGCNQVIIVRDQESKKLVPKMLQHALCLTIYEAKGLEFDDVILFNFFNDSTMKPNLYNLLNLLKISEQAINKDDFLKDVTMHQIIEKYEMQKSEKSEEEKEEQKQEKEEEQEKTKISVKDDVKCFGVEEHDGMI